MAEVVGKGDGLYPEGIVQGIAPDKNGGIESSQRNPVKPDRLPFIPGQPSQGPTWCFACYHYSCSQLSGGIGCGLQQFGEANIGADIALYHIAKRTIHLISQRIISSAA